MAASTSTARGPHSARRGKTVAADDDLVTFMEGIAGRIPGSTYRELPGTPHVQTLSKPSLVADALDEFLPLDKVGD